MILLPTAFLPDYHYLSMLLHEESAIYVGEMYQKQSYRNRTDFLSSNGVVTFSIPVQKISYPSPPTSQVMISPHGHWQHQLERLLMSNYMNSPYWFHYGPMILELIPNESMSSLVDFNQRWLRLLCEAWDIECPKLVHEMTSNDTFHPEIITTDYKKNLPTPSRYWQVFEHKFGFTPYLSSLDLLLNLGPEGRLYLKKLRVF